MSETENQQSGPDRPRGGSGPELARYGSPLNWPVLRQLAGSDLLGRGSATRSRRSLEITPRTKTADKVVKSVCPFCAVGCGQDVYVSDGEVVQIEGDDDSPISRGRLCPKGSASKQLVTNPGRITTCLLYTSPSPRDRG